MAHDVILRERRRDREVMPLMILLTDGAGNVSLTGRSPQEEATMMAKLIRQTGVHSVVINTEHEAIDRGLAQGLADALSAPCYTLHELKAKDLYEAVRVELKERSI